MSNKKQTALDFFLQKLIDLEIGKSYYTQQELQLHNAYKQAKAMEKEQIINAYRENGWNDNDDVNESEQYYNETYEQ